MACRSQLEPCPALGKWKPTLIALGAVWDNARELYNEVWHEFHPVPTIATRFASVWGLTQGFSVGKGAEYSPENCKDGIRVSEVGGSCL